MSARPWPDAESDYRDWLDSQHTPPTETDVLNPEDVTQPTPPKENHARPTADR